MKKRIDWKILIITTLMCIVPIIFGVILYNRLPEQMAVHFGLNNEPNSFAPKEFALFGIPLLMTALQIICCISSDCMEQKKQNKKYITCLLYTSSSLTSNHICDPPIAAASSVHGILSVYDNLPESKMCIRDSTCITHDCRGTKIRWRSCIYRCRACTRSSLC